MYLIGNSNIRRVKITCDQQLLNTTLLQLLLICSWGREARYLKLFLFRIVSREVGKTSRNWGALEANTSLHEGLGESGDLQICLA